MGATVPTVASVVLVSGLVMPAVAADMPPRVLAKASIQDGRCAKVEPPKGAPEVPGGDIFGITSPTDIRDPYAWSWAIENTGRAGKRTAAILP